MAGTFGAKRICLSNDVACDRAYLMFQGSNRWQVEWPWRASAAEKHSLSVEETKSLPAMPQWQTLKFRLDSQLLAARFLQ